eukprot:m51a1_g6440 putative integrin-alpha fg-gap repeat-containing protein 2 (144) ;mRNA; f:377623-378206
MGETAGVVRQVSLVSKFVLDAPGNIFKRAICLGDLDSDGVNELVVGTLDGSLYVYKNSSKLCELNSLGTIIHVAVGDVLSRAKSSIVAVTAEARCHVLELALPGPIAAPSPIPPTAAATASAGGGVSRSTTPSMAGDTASAGG